MGDFSEVKSLIEAQGRAWEEFKRTNDERLAKIEAGASGADHKAALDKINVDLDKLGADIAKLGRPGASGEGTSEAANEHKAAFLGFVRKGDERGLEEMQRKAMTVGTPADGGYAVPEQIEREIQSKLVDVSPIRAIAKQVTVSTDDYKRLFNIHGTASGWVGETAARTATNTPQLAEVPAVMGEVYCNLTASQKALDDIFFNVDGWLAEEMALEFGRAEGAAFVSGDGTNKPKGFLAYATAATADNARAFGTIEHVATGVSGDWAASNKGDTLVSVVYKMKAGHRNGAKWVTNKAILGEIRAFKEATTNAYMWQPGLAAGQPSTLLGYPIVEAEDMPAKTGNSLSIAFGNFANGYCIVDRIGIRTLRDPYTSKPNVLFYSTKRVGGMLLDSEAIKVVKFAAT